MSQTSFVVDSKTAEAIEDLKKEFGVKTNAAVIRKALALARIAARGADKDHTITLLDKDNKPQRVLLVG
jgi:hypothetical protein